MAKARTFTFAVRGGPPSGQRAAGDFLVSRRTEKRTAALLGPRVRKGNRSDRDANHGHSNGWIGRNGIHGKCIRFEDGARGSNRETHRHFATEQRYSSDAPSPAPGRHEPPAATA